MRKILIIYFYLIIILSAIEYIMRAYLSFRIAGIPYFSIPNWIDLFVTSFSLVGLYGYLYKKTVIANLFWRIFLIALVVYFFWSIFVEIKVHDKLMAITPKIKLGLEDWIVFSIDIMIFLPAYICIYLYGFRSEHIWSEHSNIS